MKLKDLFSKGNEILKENNIDDYYLKNKLLIKYLLKADDQYILINMDNEIEGSIEKLYFTNIDKIKDGYPIQYITNKQDFMGLEFFVNENVLIPQPDTEVLVEEVLSLANCEDKILDLCTGSGAIGISIANKLRSSKVDLLDISELALEVAKRNSKINNVDVKFIKSDLFENVNEKYDFIVSNPPYIETEIIKDLGKEVQNEPLIALDGGVDGLDFYRKIAKESTKFLNENGILVLEIGYNQKSKVEEILKKNGFIDVYSKKDYSNNDRIVVGKKGE